MSQADMVSMWLANAGRSPLLTASQEITLGNQVRAWLDTEDPDARTIRKGQRARERMVRSNLRLCVAACKKYLPRIRNNQHLSQEDLLQEATIGLTRAAEKFDPSTGYKFSTYAYWWIRQSIGRLVENNLSAIRVPSTVAQLAMRWRYKPEDQSLEDFAADCKQRPEWVRKALYQYHRAQTSSLNAMVRMDGDGDTTLIDLIPSESGLPLEHQDYADSLDELKQIDDGAIKDALAILEIAETATPAEVGELIGCKYNQVNRELQNLRAMVREHVPADIRERITGKADNASVRIEPSSITPIREAEPAKELVVAACSSVPSSPPLVMPETVAPSINGHQPSPSLEQKATAVIEKIQAEPVVEAPRPKRRARRSDEDTQKTKQSESIFVIVNGTHFEGLPDHIARLLVAMKVV